MAGWLIAAFLLLLYNFEARSEQVAQWLCSSEKSATQIAEEMQVKGLAAGRWIAEQMPDCLASPRPTSAQTVRTVKLLVGWPNNTYEVVERRGNQGRYFEVQVHYKTPVK